MVLGMYLGLGLAPVQVQLWAGPAVGGASPQVPPMFLFIVSGWAQDKSDLFCKEPRSLTRAREKVLSMGHCCTGGKRAQRRMALASEPRRGEWGFTAKEQDGGPWKENGQEQTSALEGDPGYLHVTGFLLKAGRVIRYLPGSGWWVGRGLGELDQLLKATRWPVQVLLN